MRQEDSLQNCSSVKKVSRGPSASDEIDLFDVINVLWGRRYAILTITGLFALIASIYTLMAPKNYETNVTILPSPIIGTEILAAGNREFAEFAPNQQDVWDAVVTNAQDRMVQVQFFEQTHLGPQPDLDRTNSKELFLQDLSINVSEGNPSVLVTLSGENPEEMIRTLNNFISYLKAYSRSQLIHKLKSEVENRRSVIEAKMASFKWAQDRNVRYQLIELEEEKETARKIAMLQIRREIEHLQEQKELAAQLGFVAMDNNLRDKPAYARGTRALQAEIGILQKRITSNSFSSQNLDAIQLKIDKLKGRQHLYDLNLEFRKYQERLVFLNNIDLHKLNITPFQSNTALIPTGDAQPNIKRLLPLGGMVGFMISIFMILVERFVSNVKKRRLCFQQKVE